MGAYAAGRASEGKGLHVWGERESGLLRRWERRRARRWGKNSCIRVGSMITSGLQSKTMVCQSAVLCTGVVLSRGKKYSTLVSRPALKLEKQSNEVSLFDHHVDRFRKKVGRLQSFQCWGGRETRKGRLVFP